MSNFRYWSGPRVPIRQYSIGNNLIKNECYSYNTGTAFNLTEKLIFAEDVGFWWKCWFLKQKLGVRLFLLQSKWIICNSTLCRCSITLTHWQTIRLLLHGWTRAIFMFRWSYSRISFLSSRKSNLCLVWPVWVTFATVSYSYRVFQLMSAQIKTQSMKMELFRNHCSEEH